MSEPKIPLTFEANLPLLATAWQNGLHADTAAARELLASIPSTGFHFVGSGSSNAAAHFMARLFEASFGVAATVRSPYDFVSSWRGGGCVILISAGGKNPDILQALSAVQLFGAEALIVFCAEPSSPLVTRAKSVGFQAAVVPVVQPSRYREGFFGSQSLISCVASAVALFEPLYAYASKRDNWFRQVGEAASKFGDGDKVAAISSAQHVVGLATGWAIPALVDFESKWVEGGLGWLEISEAKNFTHGRFMNSFRHRNETVFLLFRTPDQAAVSRFINEGIGDIFPVIECVSLTGGPLGCIDLFVRMFYVISRVARDRRVNISRPEVPDVSRRMFKGVGLYESAGNHQAATRIAQLKTQLWEITPDATASADTVAAAYGDTLQRRYRALVCDYDGTLSELGQDEIEPGVAAQLSAIAQADIPIAVVTGRGSSCISELRKALPKASWPSVFCYLYNGGAFQRLDEEEWLAPHRLENCEAIRQLLESDSIVAARAKSVEISSSHTQITVHLSSVTQDDSMLRRVTELIRQSGLCEAIVRSSGKSVDVFPPSVSKRNAVLDFKWRVLGDGTASVLIVGDQASEGGNDYDLLQLPHSFSVGTLHKTLTTGFPVIQSGARLTGPAALQRLLGTLRIAGGTFSLGQGIGTEPA